MILEMVAYKHRQLKRAHLALLVGFILMVADLVIYLGFVPKA